MLCDSLAAQIAAGLSVNDILRIVITRLLTYVFWITGIILIHTVYKQNPAIHFSNTVKPNIRQWLIVAAMFAVTLTISCISWGGFKVYKELFNPIKYAGVGLGIADFLTQYFYYFLEVVLMTIIVAFSQEAGEYLFKIRWIPYGGITLALLWGLIHIVFHGIIDGLLTTLLAVIIGIVFLVLRKNIKVTFWAVFLMFVC